MRWILAIFTVTGFNFTFWALMGLFRFVDEQISKSIESYRHRRLHSQGRRWGKSLIQSSSATSLVVLISAGGFITSTVVLVKSSGLPSPRIQHSLEALYAFAQSFPELVVVVSALWLCFTAIGGYTVSRIEKIFFLPIGPVWAINALTLLAVGSYYFQIELIKYPFETMAIILGSLAATWFGSQLAQLVSLHQSKKRKAKKLAAKQCQIQPTDVAAIIAAHNEEKSIGDTLNSLKRLIPAANIFVGSDASSDRTVEVVRANNVAALDLHPNRGKAKTLITLLNHFSVLDRFPAVMIVDADIIFDQSRLVRMLPHFDDPKVGVVVGRAVPKWFNHVWPRWSMFVTAYRIRVWRLLQFGMRFGQTWKYMNATPIIPGGSSIYRSSVLRQLEIDAPGLIIEDFNMTFEVHHKKLGKIAYNPSATIIDQEPYTIKDFLQQIKRWYVGFWQTAFRHGIWPSWFWLTMASFTLEMYLYSLFLVFVPVMLIIFAVNSFQPISFPTLTFFKITVNQFDLQDFLLGIFLVDYLLTIVVTMIERKFALLIYGLGFSVLRYLDSLMFVITLPLALFTKSEGKWVSPERRTLPLIKNSRRA